MRLEVSPYRFYNEKLKSIHRPSTDEIYRHKTISKERTVVTPRYIPASKIDTVHVSINNLDNTGTCLPIVSLGSKNTEATTIVTSNETHTIKKTYNDLTGITCCCDDMMIFYCWKCEHLVQNYGEDYCIKHTIGPKNPNLLSSFSTFDSFICRKGTRIPYEKKLDPNKKLWNDNLYLLQHDGMMHAENNSTK